MKQPKKIPLKVPLKVFTEECTRILENSSPDELKMILIGMASEVQPHARGEFIEKLSLSPITYPQDIPSELDILDDIDSLKEDILAQGDEEPDWEVDDEDSLAEYEKFIPDLSDLFDKVTVLFEQGHYGIVQKAYEKLFSIFAIEDDYGRGISIYDVQSTDLEEERARYFRSLYITTQETRPQTLLKAMEDMAHDDFHDRPTLQEIIDISSSPLPDFTPFLHQWVEITRASRKPSHDAWLREATRLLEGSRGLERLAKEEGHKRPRVFIDWMNSLIDTENFSCALNAGKTALAILPENQPLRATIGDLMALCGEHLQDEGIQEEGRWISFQAKPDLPKLINLKEQTHDSTRSLLMKQAAEVIEAHRKRSPQQHYEKSWERDDRESESTPSKTLLLHALLFSGDIDKAFVLAKRGESLGWSFDNPQPLFIAYCLIKATKCSLSHLPSYLQKFWSYALKVSQDTVWYVEGEENNLGQRLEDIYRSLFDTSSPVDPKMLKWCLEASQKRVEDIVTNQHRTSYDKAALLMAACTDVLRITNPQDTTKFFWSPQNKFPRHSAFQAELGRINIIK